LLSQAEFDLLLELVGAVRRAGTGRENRRTTVTPDGRWEISLTVDPAAGSAVLSTDAGALVIPDWLFEMRVL
jgi:hypothetical protein